MESISTELKFFENWEFCSKIFSQLLLKNTQLKSLLIYESMQLLNFISLGNCIAKKKISNIRNFKLIKSNFYPFRWAEGKKGRTHLFLRIQEWARVESKPYNLMTSSGQQGKGFRNKIILLQIYLFCDMKWSKKKYVNLQFVVNDVVVRGKAKLVISLMGISWISRPVVVYKFIFDHTNVCRLTFEKCNFNDKSMHEKLLFRSIKWLFTFSLPNYH